MNRDFDKTCECGYYECPDCGELWYPMEIDVEHQPDDGGPYLCPNCSGELSYKKEK